jgi:hypothetical protein
VHVDLTAATNGLALNRFALQRWCCPRVQKRAIAQASGSFRLRGAKAKGMWDSSNVARRENGKGRLMSGFDSSPTPSLAPN